MSPPSSGDLFEPNHENDWTIQPSKMGHNSLKAIQVITEAEEGICWSKCVLGDPDFVKLPVKNYPSTIEWVIFIW
jgi:gamma-glutamyltranspeptidase/glutathione hydrolase